MSLSYTSAEHCASEQRLNTLA